MAAAASAVTQAGICGQRGGGLCTANTGKCHICIKEAKHYFLVLLDVSYLKCRAGEAADSGLLFVVSS